MLIRNASLYDMAGLWGEKRDLRIAEGKIAQVGPELAPLGDEEIYDAAGRPVTPGFIDAHSLAGMNSQIYRFERADADETSDPVQLTLRAVDALNLADEGFAMLRAGGVTTAVTGPGNSNVIGGTGTAVKTGGASVGKRILKTETAFYMSMGSGPRQTYGGKTKAPVTRMSSAALIRENLLKARLYKEKQAEGKGDFQLGPDSLARVLDGFPVKFTAITQSDIRTSVRIAEEFGLRYTVDYAYEGVQMLDELKAHGTKIVVGSLYGGQTTQEMLEKKLENGPVWEKSGVDFCLGFCHPALNGELAQPYLALLHKFGMSREAVLKAVTVDAARLCGLEDRIGSLEPGKDADLTVWSGDPFDYYTEIALMLINGER